MKMRSRIGPLVVALGFTAQVSGQTLWVADGITIDVRGYIECAVIMLLVETQPENAPEFAGLVVDFERVSEEMFHASAGFQWLHLTADAAAEFTRAWLDAPNTLEAQATMASRLTQCLPSMNMNLRPPAVGDPA